MSELNAEWLNITTDEQREIDWAVWAFVEKSSGRVLAKIRQEDKGGTWEVSARDLRSEEFVVMEQAQQFVESELLMKATLGGRK